MAAPLIGLVGADGFGIHFYESRAQVRPPRQTWRAAYTATLFTAADVVRNRAGAGK